MELREAENIKKDVNIINNNIGDDYIIINPSNPSNPSNIIIPDYFYPDQGDIPDRDDIPEEIDEQEHHPLDIPDEIIDYLELGITEIPITHDMLCGDNRDESALAIQEAWRSYALYL